MARWTPAQSAIRGPCRSNRLWDGREFISNVLAQDTDGLFGGRLFPGIVANLDGPKMGDVEDTLRRLSRDNLLGALPGPSKS